MSQTPERTGSTMIGKPAPAFAHPDQDGKVRKLSDFKGSYVVLHWYPKDDAPGFVSTQEWR